jgi:hypothetical protein
MEETRKLAHRTDPETSLDAAERATHRSIIKAAIVTILTEYGPQTAFEIRDRYFDERERRGWPWCQAHSVDRRLSELHVADVVFDTGVRRYSVYNRAACVWQLARPRALDEIVGDTDPDGVLF